MEKDIHSIKQRMEEISVALLGSNLTKDGGLVKRIAELEIKNRELEEKIDEHEKRTAKMEVYQKIMWSTIGGFVVLIAKLIFEIIIKK